MLKLSDEQLRSALASEAVAAGIVDVDALSLPIFADVLSKATKDNVRETVSTLKKIKPGLFAGPNWSTMDRKTFTERENEMLGRSRLTPIERHEERVRSTLAHYKTLDSADMDDQELRSLRAVFSGSDSAFDRAKLDRVARRQQAVPA